MVAMMGLVMVIMVAIVVLVMVIMVARTKPLWKSR